MIFPTEERIRPVLEPIEKNLCEILLPSLGETLKTFRSGWLFGRSPATIMNEIAVQKARTLFASNPDVRCEIRYATGLFIKDFVVFKFKKANKQGLSSNIPTTLALAYHDPRQGSLYDIEEETRVEINYVTDKAFTNIERILVVSRDGKRPLLEYPIYQKKSPSRVILPSVSAPARKAPEDLVRRIRETEIIRKNRDNQR